MKLIAVFLVGSLITYILVNRYYANKIRNIKTNDSLKQNSLYNAHYRYLKLLRREFANQIQILFPNLLLQLDKEAKEYESRVEAMKKSEFNTEIADFWKRYPDINDFDFLAEEHWAQYKHSLLFREGNEKEVSKSYLEIVKYLALLCREKGDSIDTGTNIESYQEDLAYHGEIEDE